MTKVQKLETTTTTMTTDTPVSTAIPVTAAFLQAATYLPGGATELTLNKQRLPGIEMYWLRGEGLLVKNKGQEALIPSTNIKSAFFDHKLIK